MQIGTLSPEEVREVYRTQLTKGFPPAERKSLRRIESSLRRGLYRCCGIRDDAGIAAYAFFVTAGREYLLDYFAVRRDLRGKGIGRAFLEELQKALRPEAARVLLEAEDPAYAGTEEEKAVRERRLRFYLGNGIRDTGVRAETFDCELCKKVTLNAITASETS